MSSATMHPPSPAELLRAARAGGGAELGALFARYTEYVTALAEARIGRELRGKLDAADAVQETFLRAHGYFAGFRGSSGAEFAAWLRCILARVIADAARHYLGTRARDPRVERALGASGDGSSQAPGARVADSGTTPSAAASRREQSGALADALARLPDEYREVILLRFTEGLPFAEVAARMNRTLNSVEKLWLRGLSQLRQLMGGA